MNERDDLADADVPMGRPGERPALKEGGEPRRISMGTIRTSFVVRQSDCKEFVANQARDQSDR
jgi:hypothetical protein